MKSESSVCTLQNNKGMNNLSHGVPNLAANDILTVIGDNIFLEVGSHYNSVLLLRIREVLGWNLVPDTGIHYIRHGLSPFLLADKILQFLPAQWFSFICLIWYSLNPSLDVVWSDILTASWSKPKMNKQMLESPEIWRLVILYWIFWCYDVRLLRPCSWGMYAYRMYSTL